MLRVPRSTKEQAMGIAEHLPGVSAGQVIAEALNLQTLIVATIDEMGHSQDWLNLIARQLLSTYTEAVLSQRLDMSSLSTEIARGIEAEVEARARKMAEAAVPHHVAAALKRLGIPSDVNDDGELNVGEPKQQRLIEA